MLDNKGMYQGYSVEGELKINKESTQTNTSCMDSCAPVYECPEERCVHREIIHDVQHIKPIHTKIVNHHIYRHSFTPCYSCCEENVVENVFNNPCC